VPTILIGLAIAGFLIPPAPSLDDAAICQLFDNNRNAIRSGILITTLAAPFLAFFVGALSHQIRRIARGTSPLASAQTAAGACLILEFIISQMVWQTAAFRENRDSALIQLLNDYSWLSYVGVDGTAIVQMLIIGFVIFQDDRPEPLLPRWCGFLSLLAALGIFAGSFYVFFKWGPLA
jgi:hypothetical protein